MSRKDIFTLKRKLLSEEISVIFSRQSLERTKFRDKFPFLNLIQTSTKNARHFYAPPYDQRTTELNEEQEEFARHKACNFHTEPFKIKRPHSYVRRTILFRSYVLTKAKNTTTGMATHSKETVRKVDSDASLHMMG